MKPYILCLAVLALSSTVYAQTQPVPGRSISNDGPSMSTADILGTWTTPAHVRDPDEGLEIQRITPTPASNRVEQPKLPSWEQGFGWTTQPAVEVFQVSADSWGSRAMAALASLTTSPSYVAETGEIISGEPILDPVIAQRWSDSIVAAEHRLVQRLVAARAAGEPYLVWVNLPAYRLRVLDTRDGSIVMESRVIIGKQGKATPRMDTRITNLKFNPDWTPPKSSPGSKYTPSGPSSPLGRVRFSTNNGLGIYLHDTNRHDLFNTTRRAYSLGCVRVEQWHELAKILADQDDAWVDDKTVDWKTRWVDIPDVTAFLDYQRVDFDDQGNLVEAEDIYGLGNRVK